MALQFRIDGNGAIDLSGHAIDFNELKVRLMMAASRVPEPRVLLTVDGEGPVVNEAVAMMVAQAEAAGCSLFSVVRGRSTAAVPFLGDHLYSMVPAMVDADSQSAHPPVFPSDAIKARHEGSTVLFVSLDDKGQPLSVKVRDSSGFAELDASAAMAAKQWRYEPCVKNGIGRACSVRVPINFNFNRQPPAAADDKGTTQAKNDA
jgi:TonB family protein